MDFLEFEDFPNMRAYFQRLKNLFTQHEMYDGYLTEEEKCEIILAPLVGGFLTPGDAVVHDSERHMHVATLMAELFTIERVRETETSIQAEGSAVEGGDGSSSSIQSSTDSLSDSGVST